jgi:hypothetical protein
METPIFARKNPSRRCLKGRDNPEPLIVTNSNHESHEYDESEEKK